ncbi:armadillo repeat-containing protein 12 isoform X3 [Panthera tigris]|uniref:armadillo repeat-containing protein 12 isoform X3 n=1 Tax=Panthera tigris TaxID=9694 RepID=UPI001C6F728F|nr:armadillo repeat-containing protein 12 isoform X3 [Panthera tigris]XP_049508719.1 armadillo repeat-containing protein 12 isoform X3 [Panthera uncia]
MGMSVPQCLGQLHIRKGVVGLATGAGFIYLLYKAIKAGIKCQPPLCTTSPICIARECTGPGERALPQEAPAPEASSVGGPKGLAIERERHGRDSGELRRLLNSLECKQDEYAKSMILHSITRCVYLLEAEASACTTDDIALVGSMLDDKDNSVKIQALNTLKAFSGIRKFRLKVQVQAIRLLSYLAQKYDLLYDILNCQVHANFLNLFQSTQPGSLLFEVLVFAERLSEGRNSPHYRAVKWHYNEQSLHEALFGDESRLADRLLALVIHPEEEVQIQACKVIVSLQCSQDVGVRPSVCQPSRSYFNSGE